MPAVNHAGWEIQRLDPRYGWVNCLERNDHGPVIFRSFGTAEFVMEAIREIDDPTELRVYESLT